MKKGTSIISSYLNKYTVVEHINNGGNSEVYKVQDESGLIFAMKLINKNINKEKIKRFKNEMFFCMHCDNDHIVKVIDNGIIEDTMQMFYIMPFYCKTFREYMTEKHTIEEKISVFIEILKGCVFYQNKEIIHRDLKPENILMNNENKIIISDFGIAHFCEEDIITAVETKVTSKMANYKYAAPEQKAKGMKVEIKADIYALGLIFNELFTGMIPAGANYKKIGDSIKEYDFLDIIVDKMIDQSPENRYENIQEIIYDIKASIENYKRELHIENLKNIKYSDMELEDILVQDPPKLVNIKYDEISGMLFLYLSQNVNKLWIASIKTNSWGEMMGYGPERFRFEGNVAMVHFPVSRINGLQQVVDYFKSWIDNANKYYPQKLKNERERELRIKEQNLKQQIKREEEIKKALANIHI